MTTTTPRYDPATRARLARLLEAGEALRAARAGIYPIEAHVAVVRREIDHRHVRVCDGLAGEL